MRREYDLRLGREAYEAHEHDAEHRHRRSDLAWFYVSRRSDGTRNRVAMYSQRPTDLLAMFSGFCTMILAILTKEYQTSNKATLSDIIGR